MAARRSPSRWPSASAWCCTGAPSSGCAGSERRSFWPPTEAAQVDYETLRAHALQPCGQPQGLAAARFARRGLAGLIAWPTAEPVFVAELLADARPAWTPHEDPRVADGGP